MFVLPGVSAVLGVNAPEMICLLQVVTCAPHVAELHLHSAPATPKTYSAGTKENDSSLSVIWLDVFM